MSNSFSELGYFVSDLVLSFLVLIFTLRILLALCNASAYNPLTQSIIKITRPIKTIFFFIPNFGKFELSSFVVILLCHFVSFYIHGTVLGNDIIIEGVAPDGTPEALFIDNIPGFAMAVQWHPEWNAVNDVVSKRLFQAFRNSINLN